MRLQAGANVPLGRRKGRHKDYKNGDDHRKVPTIRMLLHGFTAASAQQVPSLCPKRLFREERGIAIRDMGAEATLWEAFVGDNLFWVETALGAGRLAGETAGAVGDTMQTAVLSLITEEESNADASSTRKAIFSLSNSAEAAVTRYIHGLDVLESFEGSIACSTPETLSTPNSPHTAASLPSPCHLSLPNPLLPTAQPSSGKSIQTSTESPTHAELKLRRAVEVSFKHLFDFMANMSRPPDAKLPSPESTMLAPLAAARWSIFVSKLDPTCRAAHQPRTSHNVDFAVQGGLRRASEADDVSTLIKKLAAKTCIHISARPNQVMFIGSDVSLMSDEVSRASMTPRKYAVNLICRRRALSKFFQLWTRR